MHCFAASLLRCCGSGLAPQGYTEYTGLRRDSHDPPQIFCLVPCELYGYWLLRASARVTFLAALFLTGARCALLLVSIAAPPPASAFPDNLQARRTEESCGQHPETRNLSPLVFIGRRA